MLSYYTFRLIEDCLKEGKSSEQTLTLLEQKNVAEKGITAETIEKIFEAIKGGGGDE